MSKGFDLPSNKHLGNSHDYWKAPQANSKQIIVQPLQWLPIDRDENGVATEECMDSIFNNLPCVVCHHTKRGFKYYHMIGENLDMIHNLWDIHKDNTYTHYLPIPKLEL